MLSSVGVKLTPGSFKGRLLLLYIYIFPLLVFLKCDASEARTERCVKCHLHYLVDVFEGKVTSCSGWFFLMWCRYVDSSVHHHQIIWGRSAVLVLSYSSVFMDDPELDTWGVQGLHLWTLDTVEEAGPVLDTEHESVFVLWGLIPGHCLWRTTVHGFCCRLSSKHQKTNMSEELRRCVSRKTLIVFVDAWARPPFKGSHIHTASASSLMSSPLSSDRRHMLSYSHWRLIVLKAQCDGSRDT